eukprot:TRINITY_DN3607_c0_g2_i3.p1 TRINITY_DN3607_c0_g2~~TRINITY_DN3607_c0_g2_i3.p1  ORF type:complete len:141 (-),score=48.44 TRINITY_DN3607_c0_g2_i3:143-565(-)
MCIRDRYQRRVHGELNQEYKMSNIPVSNIDKQTHDELCCTYAALILYDDNISITADKLKTLIKASGNTVENHWPSLFAKSLENLNIADLLVGGGGPAPAAQSSGQTQQASKDASAPVQSKEEPKKEEEEEVEMGDLFGDF